MDKQIKQEGIQLPKAKERKIKAVETARQIWTNKYGVSSSLSQESYLSSSIASKDSMYSSCAKKSINSSKYERKSFSQKKSKIPILTSWKPGQDFKINIKAHPSISREIMDPNLTYLAEIQLGVLHLYGTEAMTAALHQKWACNILGFIHTISFHYVVFDDIVQLLEKLKTKFPNIEAASFECACLESLAQLNALGDINGLKSLLIEENGNPIRKLSLWKKYAIYRLSPTIEQINGETITEWERCHAENLFGGLGFNAFLSQPKYRLSSLLNSSKTRKMILKLKDGSQVSLEKKIDCEKATEIMKSTFTYSPDFKILSPGFKRIAKEAVEKSIMHVDEAMKKRFLFKSIWPSMYSEILNEALEDYTDIKNMKISRKNLT